MDQMTADETWDHYVSNAANDWLHNKTRGQRKGQSYMNSLYRFDPEAYDAVTDSDSDPFYSDGQFYRFLGFLREFWEKRYAAE